MVTTDKQAPVLVAEFPEEGQLWGAVAALEEHRIGRDFIGVFIGEDGETGNGQRQIHMVSVLAPRRLHDEIAGALSQCGASAVGSPGEMAGRHGTVPHPGALEDHDMKLPMGLEYPSARRARRAATRQEG